MKGLFKYLTPFAPDQSGAVAVLYEFGGLLVICDAGGCTGNICGFDEPRWSSAKSAIFSAGLRDMDAIMGRDEHLVTKLALAAEEIEGNFAAVIGTPVPSVIATDYAALKRMLEKKTALPILTVETTGMAYYDRGAEAAYLALVKQFCTAGSAGRERALAEEAGRERALAEAAGRERALAEEAGRVRTLAEEAAVKCASTEEAAVEPGCIGVFGVNPLDLGDLAAADKLGAFFRNEDPQAKVLCYGMGAGLGELARASSAERNIVVAPSGRRAAQFLKERFGTPYELRNPLALEFLPDMDYAGKRILIIAQQVSAHTLREALAQRDAKEVVAACWFMQLPELTAPQDIRLTEEDQCEALLKGGNFDVIIADPVFRKMMGASEAAFVEYPQFAISGQLI